ncbi:toll/interleukin-1 receptor domain-containing protein [Clostridium beijerinckii]|uniref:toll/interleukin-1 receptor domain-containing protein n=1 Tax=Clostridium beijerinckii TaxID=1520 RepID=UPI000809FC27|nr:toll/interleukin-1 receptor domain-containing protein [Clostridium beijerinckii]OCA96495.1 molecular chaperone Tir [Clostridium beijerinckii]
MGETARQFNSIYIKYKQQFKRPIQNVANLMHRGFSDDDFIRKFKEIYPDLWLDLNSQYEYWHKKNEYIISKGKKSRYNFRKPYNFILDCGFHTIPNIRKKHELGKILPLYEQVKLSKDIVEKSKNKLKKKIDKKVSIMKYLQEIHPQYADYFIDSYFKTYDLHTKLEIMRELSKYKSEKIVEFFYKVNAGTRNFSLKQEAMKYIQALQLPFVLRRKKEGKTNYIDNEIVKNNNSPEILLQRIFVDDLEAHKKYDVFISHNSRDEEYVIDIYKNFNKYGLVAYVDWVSDKFDLKRTWCNASTSKVIKERIRQCQCIVYIWSENVLKSQWCPWELGYADALGKPICILGLTDESNIPQFYLSYPKLIQLNGKYCIENNEKISFKDWLKTGSTSILKGKN